MPKLKTELHTSQHRREAGTVAGDEKSGHINTKQNESILFFDSKPPHLSDCGHLLTRHL
jgi:hypothetical protein